MAVMCVRKVRMAMAERQVAVPMLVLHTGRNGLQMGMFMVRVIAMRVHVVVLQRRMVVAVRMPLCQMQDDADGHQCATHQQRTRQWLTKPHHRQQGPRERCHRKVRAGARCAQVAQCQHKQHQTDPIAAKTQKRRLGHYAQRRHCRT